MNPTASWVILVALYVLAIVVSLYSTQLLPWAKAAILVAALIISAVAYRWQFYNPFVNVRERHRGTLIAHLFEALIRKYRDKKPGDYVLRVNVMRVRRKRRLFGGKRYLRFDFFTNDYTDAEKEQEYLIGVGCCGTALKENSPVVFDARAVRAPYKDLSATQRKVTDRVKSILSVPIYLPNDNSRGTPIAILNLDSYSNFALTGFNEEEQRDLAIRYAELVGALIGKPR